MNREIKFRGKSEDEWVYGMLLKVNEGETEHGEPYNYLIQTDEKEYGEYVKCFITDNNTIGQFTGLHDISQKEIYEKDIVQIESPNAESKIIGWIEYDLAYAAYILRGTRQPTHEFENFGDYLDYKIKVLGNIIDNPELLP